MLTPEDLERLYDTNLVNHRQLKKEALNEAVSKTLDRAVDTIKRSPETNIEVNTMMIGLIRVYYGEICKELRRLGFTVDSDDDGNYYLLFKKP